MTTQSLSKPSISLLRTSLLVILSSGFINTAYASNSNQPHSTTLDPINITATRIPTRTSNLIAQTTVIDETELAHFKGQTVLDVLKTQSGFNVKQDGGMGTSSNFYIRGYDSKRVLVIIDGIRYGSLSVGQPALNLLPTDQIERIEILYGASGSSFYGADAMGGVIQIFTKGQFADSSSLSATYGYGSHNHQTYGLSGQYVSEEGGVLSLSASRNKTDGFSAIANQTGENSDNDGFDSKNFAVTGKLPLTDKLTLGTNGLLSVSKTEFDSYLNVPDAVIDQKNGAFSVFADYQGSSYDLKAKAGKSIDELDNHIGDEFTTKQRVASIISSHQLPNNSGEVIFGTEWLNQKVDVDDNTPDNGTDGYLKDSRTIKSAVFGYQYQGHVDFQVNLRHDHHSQFDNHMVYGIGIAKQISPQLRIGANYATAYRPPSLNDLYVESQYYVPSPDLDVETSKNTEAFVELANDKHITRLTWFKSQAEDMISNQFDATTYKYKATNIDKVDIAGFSVSSDWQIDHILLGADYTYTEAVSDFGLYKGNQLNNRPKHKGSAYLGYTADEFDIRLGVEREGRRYNSLTNKEELDAYTLVNLTGNYYFSPSLTISTQLNNLTNEDYTTNESFGTRYNQDGRNVFVSATYTY